MEPAEANSLRAIVEHFMGLEAKQGPGFAAGIAEAGGMTLFGTIGVSFHLRPDGSVWANEWIRGSSPDEYAWRRATRQEAAGALRVAAKRLPELAPFAPARSPGVLDCSYCGGRGRFTSNGVAVAEVWCPECCGVGFRLPEAT